MAAIGFWYLLHQWKGRVETQLRLDRCVGKVAMEFRDTLNSIASANGNIEKIRLALAASTLLPPARPPLIAALQVEFGRQEYLRWKWELRRIRWIASCGRRGDYATPLPGLEFFRPPPDSIGPQALLWMSLPPSEFRLEVGNLPLRAAARIHSRENAHVLLKVTGEWSAEWVAPMGAFSSALGKRRPGSH